MIRSAVRLRKKGGVTRADLAAACDLSEATVSFALIRHPRVSPRTQKRVFEMADHLGYVSNPAARRLAHIRFGKRYARLEQAGMLIVNEARTTLAEFYLSCIRGAENFFSPSNVTLIFTRVTDKSHWDRVDRMVRAGLVDGWLVAGGIGDEVVERIGKWKMPFVVMGHHQSLNTVHSVKVDHFEAGRLATRHLVSLGHRRIGLIGASTCYPYQREIRDGYQSVAQEPGMDWDPELIQDVEAGHPLKIADQLSNLLRLQPPPTAIVGAEPMTFQASNILKHLKVLVPQAMSIITCESDSVSDTLPEASHVKLPYEEVGQVAAKRLLHLTACPDEKPRQITVVPRLIIGTTCAPLSPSNEKPELL